AIPDCSSAQRSPLPGAISARGPARASRCVGPQGSDHPADRVGTVLRLDPNDAKAMTVALQTLWREEPAGSGFIRLNDDLFRGLAKAGPDGITKLLDFCKHEKRDIRLRASYMLPSFDPPAVKAKAAELAAALANPDDQVCFNLLVALAKAGADAKPHQEAI